VVEAAVSKFRVKPKIIAVWVTLAALLALIVHVDRAERAERRERFFNPPMDARSLLPLPMEQIGAIEIGHAGTLHLFERDASGAWLYHGVHAKDEQEHEHVVDPEAAERIAYSFGGLDRALTERRLPLNPHDDVYGISRPEMVIIVYALGDPTPVAQYTVGDVAPDAISRYVLIAGQTDVITIPEYQVENLVTLIRDMKERSGNRKHFGADPSS
jgi:hypothetical protein